MPLFLIFIIFNNHSHITFIHPSSFAEACLLVSSSRFFAQQEKNLHEVPSRESNSGLPYSKPTRYQLSHAAPYDDITQCRVNHPMSGNIVTLTNKFFSGPRPYQSHKMTLVRPRPRIQTALKKLKTWGHLHELLRKNSLKVKKVTILPHLTVRSNGRSQLLSSFSVYISGCKLLYIHILYLCTANKGSETATQV